MYRSAPNRSGESVFHQTKVRSQIREQADCIETRLHARAIRVPVVNRRFPASGLSFQPAVRLGRVRCRSAVGDHPAPVGDQTARSE